MAKLITVTALQRAAIEYDNTLRELPFYDLRMEMPKLGVNLLSVNGTDKIAIFQRKGGLARPYVINGSNTVSDEEIGKVVERTLEPKPSYTALKDHIMNYIDKKVVINAAEPVDNKTKNHPLEFLIVRSKVRTVGEDILEALFHAEYDTAVKSPMGMFKGFNTLISDEITAGEISTAKKNLISTGAISAPDDETDMEAFNKLVAFIRSANPFLRNNGSLWITQQALWYAMDALGNKLKYKNAMEYEVFVAHLRSITGSPRLNIITHPALGSGSRLMLTIPGNLDLGMGAPDDQQFVDVRDVYEDPNIIQFWMQWTAGTRIRNIHSKEFAVNDQTNTSTELSGDYS
jgi:hypothetical protein